MEDDEQSTTKMSALVSTAVEFIDLGSLCNTWEVIFGPLPVGSFLDDLHDSILHEPILPIEEAKVNINAYISTPIHSEIVHAGQQSPTYELVHMTMNLQVG